MRIGLWLSLGWRNPGIRQRAFFRRGRLKRIAIERTRRVPSCRRTRQSIEGEIRSGALPPETKLPASRDLASGLGVNRIAVTNAGAIDQFRLFDVRLLGVPVDEQGMEVERVEPAREAARPRLFYTIPNSQKPKGVCESAPRRRQLLALAGRYNVPVTEDDFVGDL